MKIFNKEDFPKLPKRKKEGEPDISDSAAPRREGYDEQLELMEKSKKEINKTGEERLIREAANAINIQIEDLVAFAVDKNGIIPDERIDIVWQKILKIIQKETESRDMRESKILRELSKELKAPQAGENLLKEIIHSYFAD